MVEIIIIHINDNEDGDDDDAQNQLYIEYDFYKILKSNSNNHFSFRNNHFLNL